MQNHTRIGAGLALCVGAALARRSVRARRAIDFRNRTVAIIGGSRGLGLVMARELAREGAHLALVARDDEELARARDEIDKCGARVIAIQADIRDAGQVESAIARIVGEYGTIDVLVNDAGIIQVGPQDHMTRADYENAMATHFWGPLFAIQAALPHMRRRGFGRIVNISSIGGKIGVPHLVPYCASKFALTGLSDSLRAELRPEGIRVTTVCPGLMRTGSTYNASFKGQHEQEFAWFHVASTLPGLTIDARRAARQIIDACRHGDAELIITLYARLAVFLNAVSPGTLAAVMAGANRALPAPTSEEGDEIRSGWQSASPLVPSAVTTLGDRAAVENNEIPAPSVFARTTEVE
jgi:NAD(P)-dependent dehydrogenase (short-subunit alcohol dehydrogenase family)